MNFYYNLLSKYKLRPNLPIFVGDAKAMSNTPSDWNTALHGAPSLIGIVSNNAKDAKLYI